MITKISKQEVEATKSLAEATKRFFGVDLDGRLCVLPNEAMQGKVAEKYDKLGKTARTQTYQRICGDFKDSTGCYGANHSNMEVGTILDIGCGSGLLSLELAQRTNGKVIGIDLSGDMIKLANANLQEKSKEKTQEIKQYWKKIPSYCKSIQEDFTKLEKNPPLFDSLEFRKGSVYDLSSLVSSKDINYIVCRNALHRFKEPRKALEQMLSVLRPRGKIYIRDLKRDADWNTIVKRMGKQRWENPELVKDAIGAMTGMLTTQELGQMLKELRVTNFKILNGSYRNGKSTDEQLNMNEYENETEYVCVIQK